MAAYEVLLLNTAIPQIQAAQSGDTYVVPRDIAINATAIISANSATDALRITQTGAGNAILVEDSANPDSTPFVVTAAGDVGVGTNSPSRKLDIALTPAAQVTGATIRSVGGTTNIGDETSIDFQVFSSTYYNGRISGYVESITGNGKGGLKFYTSSAGTSINATPSVTLDSSGNLGLGVTPSAWGGSGVKAFDVGTGASFAGSGSDAGMIANAYYNGSNWIYKTSSLAVRYQQIIGTGTHAWYTAPSGNANDPISFTQAMTLNASGNLLVGGTSNALSARALLENASGNQIGLRYTGVATYYNSVDSSGNLVWTKDGSERARITSGGYFKASNAGTYVGSTGAYHELRSSTESADIVLISSSAASPYGMQVRFSAAAPDNNTNRFLTCIDSALERCIIYSDGDLANHDGVYGTISDQKLKQDIVDAGSQWADIKAIRFRKYRMKSDVAANPDAPALLGVIAQELEQVSPGLVDEHPDMETVEVTDEDGNVTQTQQPTGTTTKTVKSSILLMKAAVALQEAMARIETLEAEVAALKGA